MLKESSFTVHDLPQAERPRERLKHFGPEALSAQELLALVIGRGVSKKTVKRNLERFPEDFMFQLTNQELMNLKSQIVTSSWGGVRRANPYAFTEQGVAMLSGVLRSKQAVHVNIAIMRAFVKLREILSVNKELANKLAQLERKIEKHDEEIKLIFDAIRQLMAPPEPKRSKIGFRQDER